MLILIIFFDTMKKYNNIVVIRKEEYIILAKRRVDYARKRDLQAIDNINTISRRHHSEEIVKVKCMICGKEYPAAKNTEDSHKYLEC